MARAPLTDGCFPSFYTEDRESANLRGLMFQLRLAALCDRIKLDFYAIFQLENKTCRYIGGIFLKTIMELLQETNKDADFAKSDDFVSDGLLDSMDIQMLAVAMEDEYHITLAGTDLMPMNYTSVDAIRDLLKSHGVEGDI